MNGRELVVFLGFAGCLAAMIVWLLSRSRAAGELERRRLDLLEKALQHPALDDATRAELLRGLARTQADQGMSLIQRLARQRDLWRTLWFGSGWLLFVVGGCLLGAHAAHVVQGFRVESVLAATIAGFAMLTLPLGLRELQARSERTSTARR